MKLSISNIGWDSNEDIFMYELIKKYGFQGIEIAPTRLIALNPYDNVKIAKDKVKQINNVYGLEISSMQSLLFGCSTRMFEAEENLRYVESILIKAIDFSNAIYCKNLVFGSPKNRVLGSSNDYERAIIFFKRLGDYAFSKHTNFSIEANPKIYGTNFINTTEEAINFIKEVNSEGLKLNLDLGTIIVNDENLNLVSENIELVNHVHISEPFLEPILPRKEHKELCEILKDNKYKNYVSIEMKGCNSIQKVKESIQYILSIFI
jgi:sugar phosphate isomerase/epimerase